METPVDVSKKDEHGILFYEHIGQCYQYISA